MRGKFLIGAAALSLTLAHDTLIAQDGSTAAPAEQEAAPAPPSAPPAPPPAPPAEAGGKIDRVRTAADCLAVPPNRRLRRGEVRDDALTYSSCAYDLLRSGTFDVALEALAQSDRIGSERNDPLFEGSIAVRNAMMRAFALNRLNRRDEAVAEIARIRGQRRYSLIVQWGLDRLLASFDGSLARFIELANARVPDHPDLLRSLFLVEVARGNMTAALPYAEAMTLENPRPIGGWTVDSERPVRQIAELTELNAVRAYVFAANGRGDLSRAMLNDIDRDIADYVGPRPVAEQGRTVPRRTMDAWEVRAGTGRQMEAVIDRWKRAIAARARLTTGNPMTFQQIQRDFPGALETSAAIDLARRLSISEPGEQEAREAALRRIEDNLTRGLVDVNVQELASLLPEVETLDRYPRFGRAGDGILIGRDRGFSQAEEAGTNIRTIRFGTVTGTNATADELVMLAAATYAQRDGFDSFILLSRRNLERRMQIIGGYGGGSVQDHGSEGQARLVMLNSASLPPEWAAQRHRLIMASDVLAAISPRQTAIEARREAASRSRRR